MDRIQVVLWPNLVTNDGRAAKMSPTNFAVFADGTAVDETKGHVM